MAGIRTKKYPSLHLMTPNLTAGVSDGWNTDQEIPQLVEVAGWKWRGGSGGVEVASRVQRGDAEVAAVGELAVDAADADANAD